MFTCSFTSISLIVMECNTSNINGTSLLLKFKFKKLKGKIIGYLLFKEISKQNSEESLKQS